MKLFIKYIQMVYTNTKLDFINRNAMPQTQGRPIVVLYIDVDRHTQIHNYPF